MKLITALQEKNDKELTDELRELRHGLRETRFKLAARQLTDVRTVRELRKNIARILMIQRERSSGETKNR